MLKLLSRADAMEMLRSADKHPPTGDGWSRLGGFLQRIAREQFEFVRDRDHNNGPCLVHAEEASSGANRRTVELTGHAFRPDDFPGRELHALNHALAIPKKHPLADGD